MMILESKSKVKNIREEKGEFFVAFVLHEGYFRLRQSARHIELKQKILDAQIAGEEITFTFDKDLNIIEIL